MIRFFDPQTQARDRNAGSAGTDLQLAIARDEFLVYYQPQIDHRSLHRAEALVRWQSGTLRPGVAGRIHPAGGRIRLILPIGHRVMMHACELPQRW